MLSQLLYKFNHAVTRRLIMGEGTTMKFIMLVVFALGNWDPTVS